MFLDCFKYWSLLVPPPPPPPKKKVLIGCSALTGISYFYFLPGNNFNIPRSFTTKSYSCTINSSMQCSCSTSGEMSLSSGSFFSLFSSCNKNMKNNAANSFLFLPCFYFSVWHLTLIQRCHSSRVMPSFLFTELF